MSASFNTWEGFTQQEVENEISSKKKRTKACKGRTSPKIYKSIEPHEINMHEPIPAEARLSDKEINTSKMDNSKCSQKNTSKMDNSKCNPSYQKLQSSGCPKNVTIVIGDNKSYEVVPSFDEAEDLKHSDVDLKVMHDNNEFTNENGINRSTFDKCQLEMFEERRKLMEEQNNKRKLILTKAIADRKQQTQSETKKLQEIQQELNRLDALLSTDVGILRNQIECASLEFNEAQKNYDHAESLFIQAKLQLFHKMERKQLLTEHLCHIIEANEQRKARKLSELMTRLEITVEDELLSDTANSNCIKVLSERQGSEEIASAVCTTPKNPKT